MPKKAVLSFALLAIAACLVSYKLGSAPTALAKARPSAQESDGGGQQPMLPTAPATWALSNSGTSSGWISVTEPAVSGVKHVATCVSMTVTNQGTVFAVPNLNLVNGNSGSSSIILHWQPALPASASNSISLCDLNVVGAVGQPMTLEAGSGTNVFVFINLVGYDAQ